MNEQEIERRIAALLDEHVIYNEKPAAELRRLYEVERRYAPTDGDERSTEDLAKELFERHPSATICKLAGDWSATRGFTRGLVRVQWQGDDTHCCEGETLRAALLAALKEGGE